MFNYQPDETFHRKWLLSVGCVAVVLMTVIVSYHDTSDNWQVSNNCWFLTPGGILQPVFLQMLSRQ